MIAKRIHARILTGCLLAMLTPAGRIAAQGEVVPAAELASVRMAPQFRLRIAAAESQRPTIGYPVPVDDSFVACTSMAAPAQPSAWFREAFESHVAVLSTPAEPSAASAADRIPSTVQHLRRASSR